MNRHILIDRSEKEVLWFQRRSFLSAAAAWTAMGGFAAAHAQSRSNIVELQGDALLNGQRLYVTVRSGAIGQHWTADLRYEGTDLWIVKTQHGQPVKRQVL